MSPLSMVDTVDPELLRQHALFAHEITDPFGDPITDEKGRNLTIGRAIVNALYGVAKGDEALEPATRAANANLAFEVAAVISNTRAMRFDLDTRKLIKDRIGVYYIHAGVVRSVWEALE